MNFFSMIPTSKDFVEMMAPTPTQTEQLFSHLKSEKVCRANGPVSMMNYTQILNALALKAALALTRILILWIRSGRIYYLDF